MLLPNLLLAKKTYGELVYKKMPLKSLDNLTINKLH